MITEYRMPKLAMAMNEGTLTDWLLAEGDAVARNAELFSIETEKTTYEVEATRDGFLHITIPAGKTVPVEAVVGYIAATEAELAELQAAGSPSSDALPDEEAAPEQSTPAPDSTPGWCPAGRPATGALGRRR